MKTKKTRRGKWRVSVARERNGNSAAKDEKGAGIQNEPAERQKFEGLKNHQQTAKSGLPPVFLKTSSIRPNKPSGKTVIQIIH